MVVMGRMFSLMARRSDRSSFMGNKYAKCKVNGITRGSKNKRDRIDMHDIYREVQQLTFAN